MTAKISINQRFAQVKPDNYWSFEDLKRTDTSYITHGYHRYPAKFIPQLASELIQEYTNKGDLVVDPFGGCGTTAVESKVRGRRSVGIDINPVAVLIAEAKKTAIEPKKLERAVVKLYAAIDNLKDNKSSNIDLPNHERIDYWFREKEKQELAVIYGQILSIRDKNIRKFLLCGFSNILKNCSIWMQKSNKPTRDFRKIPSDPYRTYFRQIRMMQKGNESYYSLLMEKTNFDVDCEIRCTDARDTKVRANSASLIVTSPPYVTSYEYADLHQLSALWFQYTKDIKEFRQKFIGSAQHKELTSDLNSTIAEEITLQLKSKHKKTSSEVSTYFSAMNETFLEMKRVLKKGGRACIVIGNTSLQGVRIQNAEVFVQQMENLGLDVEKIILREIPSKILPSIRDKSTGRFTKATSKHKTYAYPTEYILVVKKP